MLSTSVSGRSTRPNADLDLAVMVDSRTPRWIKRSKPCGA
jgi:hypothetical protein